MENNTIKNSGSLCASETRGKAGSASVSDDQMTLFSQLLDESSGRKGMKESAKETIYNEKAEKEADKLKEKMTEQSKPRLSASKEYLYNFANRDKATLSLAQKSFMGLSGDGMSKAAVMHNSFTGAQAQPEAQAKAQQMPEGAKAAVLGEKALEMKGKEKSADGLPRLAANANANAMAESKQSPEQAVALKAAEKAEKSEAQRNIKREEVIKQIINHVEMKNLGSKTELTIKLNPEFMGNMKMRLLFDGDKVSAEFNTTSKEVREALEESAQELSDALAEQGVKVSKVNVHLVDDIA